MKFITKYEYHLVQWKLEYPVKTLQEKLRVVTFIIEQVASIN
jgi:hypothetical protein